MQSRSVTKISQSAYQIKVLGLPPKSRSQKNAFFSPTQNKSKVLAPAIPAKHKWSFLALVCSPLGHIQCAFPLLAVQVDFVSFCRSAKFSWWQGKESSVISQEALAPNCLLGLEHWGANATSGAKMH